MPCAYWKPTGLSTWALDAATELRMCSGFQPVCATVPIACAPAFGVVMSRKTSAPRRGQLLHLRGDGRVGRPRSVSWATTLISLPSMPSVKPPSRSLPKPSFW